jgi:hypothetical protein
MMIEAHPWLGIEWPAVEAIASVLLVAGVGVTLWGLWETRRAATADLELARRQLQASYRPLLIEVLRNGLITPDMEAIDNPHTAQRRVLPFVIPLHLHGADLFVDPRIVYVNPEKGYVSIPLRNVGAGLAVVDDEKIEVRGLDSHLEDVTVDRPRVPPGETTRVNIALLLAEGEEAKVFSVTVPYGDLAGEQNTDVTVHLRRSENRWEIDNLEHSPTRWGHGKIVPEGQVARFWRRFRR